MITAVMGRGKLAKDLRREPVRFCRKDFGFDVGSVANFLEYGPARQAVIDIAF
jgi:hypothetical protein